VMQVFPMTKVTAAKTKKEILKRSIILADKSLLSVEVTFWGDAAEKYNEDLKFQVVAVKACKVSEYEGGKSLSASFGSRVHLNPDKPEAHALRAWFDNQGKNAEVDCISKRGPGGDRRITFQQVKDEGLGNSEKADWFVVKATVTFYRHEIEKPPWYLACPTLACNKKVIPDGNEWICEKCQGRFTNASPRYILSLMCCDSTGSTWLTAFNDVAEIMLGHSATELAELAAAGNRDKEFEAVFQDANFKSYLFKCRAKQEKRVDDTKVRLHIQSIAPLNYRQECISLLDQIAAY